MKQAHPEMLDVEVAHEVGCDPSTLSGSTKYKAVRDALAFEHATRLNRSRKSRGNDMNQYSDDPKK
jgi:hypothetical protein